MFSALMSFTSSSSPPRSSGSARVVTGTLNAAEREREARALRPVVRGVVAHVLGEAMSSADVEECTQEAMRRAFEGRDSLRDGQALAAWASGIARHVALDEIRSRRRARARLQLAPKSEGEASDGLDAIEKVADSAPDAFEQLARADRDARIRAAMGKLPEKQREVLTLFHLEGLDYKAIAARLNVPLGTVATWVLRGRRAMAEGLDLQKEES